MSPVEHVARTSKACSCGAQFRNHRALRRHVRRYLRGAEPTWSQAMPQANVHKGHGMPS